MTIAGSREADGGNWCAGRSQTANLTAYHPCRSGDQHPASCLMSLSQVVIRLIFAAHLPAHISGLLPQRSTGTRSTKRRYQAVILCQGLFTRTPGRACTV